MAVSEAHILLSVWPLSPRTNDNYTAVAEQINEGLDVFLYPSGFVRLTQLLRGVGDGCSLRY